ncbi:uncharacterized protein METZ01_LOCUS252838, partial [marine metagenome]
SGSASTSSLEDTAEKRFATPTFTSTAVTGVNEDVEYSYSITTQDADTAGSGLTISCHAGCTGWLSSAFTDNGDGTATLVATPADANVGAHNVEIRVTDGTNVAGQPFTITVTEVNDEPTVSASAAGGTFTEGGSNVVMYTSGDVADGDSIATQTWSAITVTITNVADEEEYLVIDGSECDITAAATCVANTATNAGAAVVTLAGGLPTTATVVWTADASSTTDAEMETLINAIAYKNDDDNPTAGARVITITTLKDEGGTANSGDDSVTVTIAATATVVAVNDAPASAGDTATVNEDTAYNSWTASSDWGYSDAEGTTMVSIKLVSLPGDGTLTDDDEEGCATQGTAACEVDDIILLAHLDDLTYTGDANFNGAETFTFQVYDGALFSATATMAITVSAVNDVPTWSASAADVSGNEDAAISITGATIADVDDSSMDSFTMS